MQPVGVEIVSSQPQPCIHDGSGLFLRLEIFMLNPKMPSRYKQVTPPHLFEALSMQVLPRTATERKLRIRLFACAVLVSLAASLPACSGSKPDIEVSIHRNELYAHMMFIKMQAIADSATIKDVKVNRGNCPLVDNSINRLAEKVTLKFGEHWTAYPRDCSIDKVKEVEVTTDKGTFAYSF